MELSERQRYAGVGVAVLLVFGVLAVAGSNFFEGSAFTTADIDFQDNYTQGATVTEELSVSTSVEPDTSYSDGSITYIYGKTSVVKNGNTISESDWQDVEGPTFSKQFSRTVSDTGEYGYVVVLAKAESSYESGSWSDYNITRLDDSSYFFRVESAPEPPSPENSLQSFFDDLLGGLFQLIGF